VSWQWSMAAGEQREYAVETDQEAEALRQALYEAGRGLEVHGLALSTILMGNAEESRAAELFRLCSALKKVEVWQISEARWPSLLFGTWGKGMGLDGMLALHQPEDVVLVGTPSNLALSRSACCALFS
jgi:hypothetical protein